MNLPKHLQGDGPCEDCGTPDNIIWYVESEFWNEIMRKGGEHRDPFLCIVCFVRRTDEAGYVPSGWRLTPMFQWQRRER